jgi:hypothetical protein
MGMADYDNATRKASRLDIRITLTGRIAPRFPAACGRHDIMMDARSLSR